MTQSSTVNILIVTSYLCTLQNASEHTPPTPI